MARYLQAETKIDGSRAMFTSGRRPSFTTLGTETKGARTAEEALKEAQLDWGVYKTDEPVNVMIPRSELNKEELRIFAKDKFMTYRYNPITNEPESLGVVGSRYTPVQNLEAFSLLNNIADDSGAVFDSAGSLDGGKKVFMTMKLPEGIQVGGVDKVDMYLLAWNAHDGSSSFSIHVTPIRLWCQNQIRMIMRTAESSYTLRHTPRVNGKVIAAREALGLTFKYVEEFERQAELLLGAKYSDKEFYRSCECK